MKISRLFNRPRRRPGKLYLLDRLLGLQPYRLAYWRVSLDMINYRRFFSVNDLIGLRVEDPRVFEASHSLLFDLIREGKVSGVRIDHIDGLYDPLGYLRRLQSRLAPGERPRRTRKVSMWWWKRFSPRTNPCRRNGRLRAPPAMIFSIPSTGSSSSRGIPGGRAGL